MTVSVRWALAAAGMTVCARSNAAALNVLDPLKEECCRGFGVPVYVTESASSRMYERGTCGRTRAICCINMFLAASIPSVL